MKFWIVSWLVLGLVSTTQADTLLVVRTGHEPLCLDVAAVGDAIERHSGLRPHTAGDAGVVIAIRVAQIGDRLEVAVAGGGHDAHSTLDHAPCDTLPDVIAAYVASELAVVPELPLPEISVAAPEDDGATRRRTERAILLAEALHDYRPRSTNVARAGYLVMTGTGAAYGAFTIATADRSVRWLALDGTINLLIGGVAAIARPDSDDAEVMAVAGYFIGLGEIQAAHAFGVDPQSDSRATFHPTDLVTGGAYAAVGLWFAIDHVRNRPTPARTIWQITRRLSSPDRRARVTEAELASYEQAYRRSETARRRYAIPLALGAVANLALGARERDGDESDRALINASVLAMMATIVAVFPNPIARYEGRLQKAGIQLEVAPLASGAAVSMRGRF